MALTLREKVKKLLKKYQLRLSKRLGQNFLINKKAIKKIIKAADLKPNDNVLEIGPGIGTLTIELLKKSRKVIAVEKDKRMVEVLRETLKDFKNVKIVEADIRNWKMEIGNYIVVGNLPFYLTAPVIRKFLEAKNPPEEMVLVVQKEVGQRICAKPPQMNLLAVSVQLYTKPEIIDYIPSKAFWPSPKVNGAIIKLKVKSEKLKFDKDLFFKIVRAGFSQPRKNILNNLVNGLALSLPNGLKLNKEKVRFWLFKNNIQPTQRAETLTIENWTRLTKSLKKSRIN